MGITPIADRHAGFQPYMGYAQTAFFGGRTSAHIRKVPVPVVYVDFLSMYPTVNSLMGLWDLVIARNIKIVNHCQEEINNFLSSLQFDELFEKDTWRQLRAFVRVLPDGDLLPTRCQYNADTKDWQVAVNYLHASRPEDALWFSLSDVVASKVLTGKVPKIIDAFRLEPRGQLSKLQKTKLRGAIDVDPRKQDFFKVVIEERKKLGSRRDLSDIEKERLDKALKVLANATSYGIYGEMNRQDRERQKRVRCYGVDPTPYHVRVSNPDQPGEYCFPPLASLITGAARLMLALLEKSIVNMGGTYAMEDTDSMAIVANKNGGLRPCSGGNERMPNGSDAIQALSWEQVAQITKRFENLRPYDPKAIPGSILKIEDHNFDPKTGKQRQLWCFAISAKRYDLFVLDKKRQPSLLRKGINNKEDHWSEHGLGHLLNPTGPGDDDRDWIAQVWLWIVRKHLGFKDRPLGFERTPAVGRVTVSSPFILEPFEHMNESKPYSQQIKPFNFLLSCHVRPFGYPVGVDPNKFHLISPYELNPKKWLLQKWVDQHSGKEFFISTSGNYSSQQTARVKTYGDVIGDYEFHPESKCADATGQPSTKQSVGLLQRRHVRIDQIEYIGKESNMLEEVAEGLIHDEQGVYTNYPDPRRDEWHTKIVPALQKIPLRELIAKSGLSRRALIYIRRGKTRPHKRHRKLLASIVASLERQ